jgi:hypothetical protein
MGRPHPAISHTELHSKAPPRGCPGGDGEPTQPYVVVRRGVGRGDNKDGAKKATGYQIPRLMRGYPLVAVRIFLREAMREVRARFEGVTTKSGSHTPVKIGYDNLHDAPHKRVRRQVEAEKLYVTSGHDAA